jgi:hypothetical protein
MGKGSKRRLSAVSDNEMERNWDRAFSKKKRVKRTLRDKRPKLSE